MTTTYGLSLVVVFVVALLASIGLTQFARRIAPRFGLVDIPGGRRQHSHPVARLGSLPLWGAFTFAAGLSIFLPVERGDPNELLRLAGLLIGGTLIFLFGLLDDKYDLPWYIQFIGQIVVALIAISCLIFIERYNDPLSGQQVILPFLITLPVSVFWLVLMMNTVNFLDGSDGLASGVVFIAAALLFIHTYRQTQLSVSLLMMALLGTLLGFLIFNWYPARIFMGSGAVYLGYILGALSIIGGAKMATILLVMGLPLLDVGIQVARRLSLGKNPLKGDRGHLHFRLLDAHIGPRTLAIGYYLFCTLCGALALFITSRQFKLLSLILLGTITVIGFFFVERRVGKPPSSGE